MITLAIEQSTSDGSIALLDDDRLISGQSWRYSRFERQDLFSSLRRVLDESSVTLNAVEAIAVGLGPGSFTGIRISVAAAQAIALPGSVKLLGLSSGEALAYDIFRETGAERTVILGDARRQCVWFAHFEFTDGRPVMVHPWSLQPVEEIAASIPDNATVAGPDWDRIGDRLPDSCPDNCHLIHEARIPTAASVGQLAFHQFAEGDIPAPLEPIYLHPPVSTGSRD